MSNFEQHWDPAGYLRHAAFNITQSDRVLSLLAPQTAERVLDLGCGEGALTQKLVDAGCSVIGVDSDQAMVDAACERGLDARLGKGDQLGFEQSFDAVFSNAALHWMRPPAAVIQGVRRALQPGGRFVGELGGHGVLAGIRVALHAVLARRGLQGPALEPWFFPTAEGYSQLLTEGGFEVQHIELVPRPTALPTGLSGWLQTFAGPLLQALPEAERGAAHEEVLALAAPVLRDETGRWTADYVRLRFAARLRHG